MGGAKEPEEEKHLRGKSNLRMTKLGEITLYKKKKGGICKQFLSKKRKQG